MQHVVEIGFIVGAGADEAPYFVAARAGYRPSLQLISLIVSILYDVRHERRRPVRIILILPSASMAPEHQHRILRRVFLHAPLDEIAELARISGIYLGQRISHDIFIE